MSERAMPFIDPTAGGGKTQIALAPRPMDLAGKIVGLIDNTKEQGDVILETVAHALRERYGVARVIIRRKEAFLEARDGRADRRDGEGSAGGRRRRRRVRVLHVVQCARHQSNSKNAASPRRPYH